MKVRSREREGHYSDRLLGDIIVNQQEGNPTVEIRLANPVGTPAAHNVSSIREASPAGHYVNIIPGSHITGSVLGAIDFRRVEAC
jgi:hypothetical protein